MSGKRHLALGEAGEEMAVRHLVDKGMRVVARRVRCRHGELDIVARDGKEWVFVEVKTRASDRMGCAATGMTSRKRTRMAQAVLEYIGEHRLENSPIRLDLVAIDFDANGVPGIEHYPGGVELRDIRGF